MGLVQRSEVYQLPLAHHLRLCCCRLLPAGQLEQLLSLPWAGVLTLKRDSLAEPVPVVEVSLHPGGFVVWKSSGAPPSGFYLVMAVMACRGLHTTLAGFCSVCSIKRWSGRKACATRWPHH